MSTPQSMQQLWLLTLMTHAFASGQLHFIFFGQFQLIEVHRGSLKRCRNGPMPVCEQLARYERLQYKRRPKCGPTHTHASTHTQLHTQTNRQKDRQCGVIIAHFTVWCNNYSKANNYSNNKNKQHLAHIQNCQQPKQAYSPNPFATLLCSLSLVPSLASAFPLPCPVLASAVISLFLII